MPFKVGDRVRLVSLKCLFGDDYDPSECDTIGNIGTVKRSDPHGFGFNVTSYLVAWDNGTLERYHDANLKKLSLNMRNK